MKPLLNFKSMPMQISKAGLRRPVYLMAGLTLVVTLTVVTVINMASANSFNTARQEIMLRQIGHQVLLQSGDSTSRVLPVKQLSEDQYLISFEKEFAFHPDSLVKIISTALKANQISDNYVVDVIKCSDRGVIFGYAISKKQNESMVPCSGRRQPKSCYQVLLRFEGNTINNNKSFLIAGIPLLAFIGFIVLRSVMGTERSLNTTADETESIQLGDTTYTPALKQITYLGDVTPLTGTEARLLLIFAYSINSVVERARLQKEIWEDDGVIVGRSLDVFISKLRKKLSADSSIRIVNIHGKGYKLTAFAASSSNNHL